MECTSVHILGYIKCSKWRPLIFTQQRRRLRHWSTASSMILCCKPDHSAIRRRFRSSRTLIAVLYTRSCITPQILSSTGFKSGLFGGHKSGLTNCGVERRWKSTVSRARCAGALSCWKMNSELIACEYHFAVTLAKTCHAINLMQNFIQAT